MTATAALFDPVLLNHWLTDWWPVLLATVGFLLELAATVHVVLTKRNVQARAGWVAIIWLVPLVGVLLYLLLGINRIRRRAVRLNRRGLAADEPAVVPVTGTGDLPSSLQAINRVINQITRRPLLPGNLVAVYDDGAACWQAMLDAIEGARRSIALCTYIFDHDALGHQVVQALARARARGVEVRVLADAVGLRYSWFNPVERLLQAADVRLVRFLPPRYLPWHLPYANLRNHRKILVIDGELGFTGGMNVRAGHIRTAAAADAILDLHFALRGPVVAQLQRSFQEDWLFAAGETLRGELWFPTLAPAGDALARGISDGPDDDDDRLLWAYLAGIQGARESLYILTPYFLPEPELVSALNAAAMRGVAVHIVVPEHSNQPLVDWSTGDVLEPLLEHGCRVWLTPPPFDHGKLFLVDDAWALIGSGNWDPRSLKLNFEFVVEVYDPALGRRLRYLFEDRIGRARELSLAELRRRPFLIRLRDGLAGLLSPYL